MFHLINFTARLRYNQIIKNKEIKELHFILTFFILSIPHEQAPYFVLAIMLKLSQIFDLKINGVHFWRLPLDNLLTSSWEIWTGINCENKSIIFMHQKSGLNESKQTFNFPNFKHVLHVYLNPRVF